MPIIRYGKVASIHEIINNYDMNKLFWGQFFFAACVLATEPEMNGISISQYGDFTKNWNLVTVRYRQDTHEMRFTYANPVAWKALQRGASIFPDGAVFTKVGFKTGFDPSFSNSLVPSGARRFQYMVKDSKKYSSTDGWGYALFQSNGELFEGDVSNATISCHACHKVVANRNYVFSEPIETSPLIKNLQSTNKSKKEVSVSSLTFLYLTKKSFKSSLKRFHKRMKINSLDIIDGDLRKSYFGGTLDEITPILINKLLQTKSPVGFVSDDQNTFKVIKLQENSSNCTELEDDIKIFEFRDDSGKKDELLERNICYSKKNI